MAKEEKRKSKKAKKVLTFGFWFGILSERLLGRAQNENLFEKKIKKVEKVLDKAKRLC